VKRCIAVVVSALLAFLLLTDLYAQEVAGIKGKAIVSQGRKVILDVGHLKATSKDWKLLNPPNDGDEGELNLPFVTPDGNTLVFVTTVTGKYYFAVALEIPSEVPEGKAIVRLFSHELTVVSPSDPAPTPPKPLPAGKYQLAKFTYDTASGQLPADLCKKMARVYRSAAGKVTDGTLKTGEEAYLDVRDGLEALLTTDEDTDLVDTKLTQPLSKRLATLTKDGKVATVADLAVVFAEIALGLESCQ
jgi:hypothetical protein